MKSITTKNKLFAKCHKKKKHTDSIAKYKIYLNKLTTIKRLAKEQYYTSQLIEHKQSISKQWSIINELLEKGRRKQNFINKLMNKNNKIIEKSSEISNTLNDYFINMGPNLNAKIDNCQKSQHNHMASKTNSFFFQPIVPMEVFREISRLNAKKSPGPENIPIKFYKTANEEISNFLSILCNKSVKTGYFPYSLKLAKVIPVHKSGKHSLLNNYRPISLLSPISKILESLISKRLTKYLEDSNIISVHQFGFRKSHSTSHAITDIYSQISSNKDHDYYTCVILLDLRTAFDTVNHNILLKKLEIYGIRGNILELFYHYLSNRSQFVYVNNTASNKLKIKCGVPQGSNLGPILFSLFINDLPEVSEFDINRLTRLNYDENGTF